MISNEELFCVRILFVRERKINFNFISEENLKKLRIKFAIDLAVMDLSCISNNTCSIVLHRLSITRIVPHSLLTVSINLCVWVRIYFVTSFCAMLRLRELHINFSQSYNKGDKRINVSIVSLFQTFFLNLFCKFDLAYHFPLKNREKN